MQRGTGGHRHAVAVAYLALVVALSGSAYAAATVSSRDVVNESLKSADLKDEAAVKSSDVRDDDKAGGGLRGNDIIEGTLGTVPEADHAASADYATNASFASSADSAGSLGGGAFRFEGRIDTQISTGTQADQGWTFGNLSLTARCIRQDFEDPEFQLRASSQGSNATFDVAYVRNGGDTSNSSGANLSTTESTVFTESALDVRGVGTAIYRDGGQVTVIQFRIYVTGYFNAQCHFAAIPTSAYT